MITYWDLTEKERASLSREDLNRYVDAELMMKGVLRIGPLELDPEAEMPEPDHRVWTVKDGYHDFPIAFPTIAAAQAFVALGARRIENGYCGNTSVEHLSNDREFSIVEKGLFTQAGYDRARATIVAASNARKENEEKTKAHLASEKAQTEALNDMTSDWYECRNKSERMAKVIRTYRDYVKTAGDPHTASRFLAKVFTESETMEAAEWFNESIPWPSDVEAAPAQPAPASEGTSTDDCAVSF